MNTQLQTFLDGFGLNGFEPNLNEEFHDIREDTFKGWYIGGQKKTQKGTDYVLFTLGDWRTGERHTFVDGVSELTPEEKREYKKQQKLEEEKINKLKASREAEIALKAVDAYNQLNHTGHSKYLAKKAIPQSYGAKCVKNSWGKIDLVIPMKDSEGKLWGYQTIDETGEKGFLPGQRIEGCYFQFGNTLNDEHIFICEGFATGASIYAATKKPTIVAFNTANLKAVGKAIRDLLPKKPIIFCADEDKFKKRNYGREKAVDAAQAAQAQVIFPKFKDEKNEPTDFNDLHVQEGLERVTELISSHRFYPPELTIKTENSGFHDIEYLKNGEEKRTPNIDDLRSFFDRMHKYLVLSTSEIVYVWTGTHYEEFDEAYIKAFAETHFDPKPNNKTVSEFVEKIYRTNVKAEDWFGVSTESKTNLKNGVYDFKTGEILPHSASLGFRYCLPYEFDSTAQCPTWQKFLNDVTLKTEDAQKVIEEFIGYTLSGDSCWLQKALVLEGQGNNGKSTFIATFLGLLGEHNSTSASLASLNSETNRQTLDGKLANLAEENESTLGDSTTFKNLVSGGRMLVRQLYKKPYYMKNRAKLVLSFNTLPVTRDVTEAYFRRFILIPFRAVFKREIDGHDPFMEEKLKKEFSGIFNRCVSAYKEVLVRQELTESVLAKKALDSYREELDPLVEWLDEHVQLHKLGNGSDEKFVPLSKIYTGYASYLEHNNYKEVSKQSFSKKLKELIPDYDKRYDFVRAKDEKDWYTKRGLKAVTYHESPERLV